MRRLIGKEHIHNAISRHGVACKETLVANESTISDLKAAIRHWRQRSADSKNNIKPSLRP